MFVFGYSMFFFYNRSSMSGALQTVQFFGYTLLTCYVFFLSLGTVGFFSALKFVRYIYANVKMDWVLYRWRIISLSFAASESLGIINFRIYIWKFSICLFTRLITCMVDIPLVSVFLFWNKALWLSDAYIYFQ